MSDDTKERPILFSAPMVKAILSGSKTQTRRIVKHTPSLHGNTAWDMTRCPYGQPGDRLWVRETWCHAADPDTGRIEGAYYYRATDHDVVDVESMERAPWKPSIHMPRAASRITLEITGLYVERLQDISEAAALAEGVAQIVRDSLPVQQCGEYDAIDADAIEVYQDLWEQINGPGSWDANPWVWVIQFRRLEARND